MRFLDTPVRLAAGRTPRELLLLGNGVACIASAILHEDHSWNIYAYAAATALFAIRFFAARVLYLSWCVAAFALQAANAMRPGGFDAVWPTLVAILLCALALSGADLVRRFDDEGRGLGPWRNYWRDLSHGQRRHIAWGMHLVGATGGLLHHMWFNVEGFPGGPPTWLYVGVAATSVIGFLYLSGRAVAAPASILLGGAVAWKLHPYVGDAWAALHGRPVARALPPEVWMSQHYTVVGFVAAVATAAVACSQMVAWLRELPASGDRTTRLLDQPPER